MPEIIQKNNPVLREIAKPVPTAAIGSEKIRQTIADMAAAMHRQKDGVAIAAPQIGILSRIFVISGKLLKQAVKNYKGGENDLVFINPELVKVSKEKHEVEEGCLSVRWLYGKVRRAVRVTLRAYDEQGREVERGASGLLAQIFQHEMDHLNGILFTDKAKAVWEMSDAEIAELSKQNG